MTTPKTTPDKKRAQDDFPTNTQDERYIIRRDFAKVLTMSSALLVMVNGVIAGIGLWVRRRGYMGADLHVGNASQIPTGGSVLFRYPTNEDPCILVRTQSGALRAYSQVCTHLSCAVVHRPEQDGLLCPCHRGEFSANDGRPIAGPPTRKLPRIWIEQRGDDLFAVGKDV